MNIDFSTMPREGTPFAEQDRARAAGPIFWSDALHGWVVTNYADVKQVMSDSVNFSAEDTPLAHAFGTQAMLVIDSPLHHKMRAVWAKPASLSGVAAIADDMARIVSGLIQPIAPRLKAGEEVELVALFEAFVSEMITRQMGISSDYKTDLLNWNRVISDLAVLALEESDPRFKLRLDAKEAVYALLRTAIVDRRERFARGEQPEDLISLMIAAEGRDGITQANAIDNVLILVLGALDTTVRWMGNVLAILHRHPDVLSAVRADHSLLPQAAEEAMRVESVINVNLRIVKRDGIELCGQALKAGDFVYTMPATANRDPQIFERPDEFDMTRKPKLHLGFGFGMHQCLGMNIARKEVLSMVTHLLDDLPPLEIVECDYGASWALWGPARLVVRAAKQ